MSSGTFLSDIPDQRVNLSRTPKRRRLKMSQLHPDDESVLVEPPTETPTVTPTKTPTKTSTGTHTHRRMSSRSAPPSDGAPIEVYTLLPFLLIFIVSQLHLIRAGGRNPFFFLTTRRHVDVALSFCFTLLSLAQLMQTNAPWKGGVATCLLLYSLYSLT